jgi:methionine synthase II (cobalamin-independent)
MNEHLASTLSGATPRTDAVDEFANDYCSGFDAMRDLARQLEQENERLRNAIIDVLDVLEPEESADLQGENWQPNLAMSVCSTLREAIGERNG